MRVVIALTALSMVLLVACSSTKPSNSTATTATTTNTAKRPPPAGDVTVVSMNVLHGAFCGDGNHCQAPDRVALLARLIEAAKCPDVVALQEISSWIYDLAQRTAGTL